MVLISPHRTQSHQIDPMQEHTEDELPYFPSTSCFDFVTNEKNSNVINIITIYYHSKVTENDPVTML
jgi:hypothetical protein